MKFVILLSIFFSLNLFAKSYRLSNSFMKEMMCLHNMDEKYCQEWVNKGTISLGKYRKIEQGCLNGVQFLCTYVVYVQERMPTPMTNEMIAMAEFGCKSGNGVHCLIMASIDPIDQKLHLENGCKAKEPEACKRLAKLRKSRVLPKGKVAVDIEQIKKGIKDALNKMMGHK